MLPAFSWASISAQDAGPVEKAPIAARIETTVELERAAREVPALAVACARKGKTIFEQAFGKTDLENDVAARPESRFRTASVAKPMTAVAVMQLVEGAKLELDAPIRKYCPAFPEKPWPVTVRQLLGHLGGIRHYQKKGEAQGKEQYLSLQDSLEIFKDDPLVSEPGTKYHYTTYGYTLLGCAIEAASGLGYADYMRQHVWGPAGMAHTCLDQHHLLISGRARGYMKLSEAIHRGLPDALQAMTTPGQFCNASLHDTSMKVPGGGLLSTAGDLARFGLAMLDDRLVRPETRELMWAAQSTRDGKPTA
jgi:CubicO group peptidase (beta-lactamase class C family)